MIKILDKIIRKNLGKKGEWYKVVDLYFNPNTGEFRVKYDDAITEKKEVK